MKEFVRHHELREFVRHHEQVIREAINKKKKYEQMFISMNEAIQENAKKLLELTQKGKRP